MPDGHTPNVNLGTMKLNCRHYEELSWFGEDVHPLVHRKLPSMH